MPASRPTQASLGPKVGRDTPTLTGSGWGPHGRWGWGSSESWPQWAHQPRHTIPFVPGLPARRAGRGVGRPRGIGLGGGPVPAFRAVSCSRFCGVGPGLSMGPRYRTRIQPFGYFGDSLVETLPDDPREPVTEELKSEPVESHVEKISRHPAFTREYLSERAEVFPELRKGELRNPRQRILDHVPKLLPGSDLFVGESTRREFAEKVDIMELPAFSMCAAYNQGMSQMKGYQYSDYEDHLHLAAMAYCDVSFADGRTCEALKQGKSRILPTRNGQFRQWLATLQPLDRSSDIELPQSPTRPCQALHDLEPPSSQG